MWGLTMRRMIVVVVLLALVAASCGGDDDASETSAPLVDRSPAALDDALDTAGIAVIIEPSADTDAPAGVQLSAFQVENMARELDRGQGYVGAELDRLGGPPGGLPFSFLLAGWLSSQPTSTAQAAASLMGEQEWEHASAIVYPTAVLTLFAADALSSIEGNVGGAVDGDDEGAYGAPRLVASAEPAEPVTGVCSALAGWFSEVLDFIFESLKVATDDAGFLGFLGSIWNVAIDLFRAVVGGAVEALAAPIIAIVADAIGVIGTLSMVASLLVPWSLEVLEDEPRTRFAVGDEDDVENGFTARVDTNLDIEWPATVEDCARVAGFALPDPETAVGSTIEWQVTGLPDYGETIGQDARIDDEARYEWITGREATDDGAEEVGVVAVTAVVTSAQVRELQAMLATLITAQVPIEPLGSLVAEVFDELAGPVLADLATLIESRGSTSVRVEFHDQTTPTTTSDPGNTPGKNAAPWEGNVCDLLDDDQVAAIFEGRPPTEARPADSNSVAADGYGGASCRWKVSASEFLLLDVFPSEGADVLELAAYDPFDSWYPEMLGGIGDEAVVMLWNGDPVLGGPHGSSGAIVVFQGQVGLRLALTANFSAEPVPVGMVAAARTILEPE